MIKFRLTAAILAVFVLPGESLGDEVVLGRWCDTWFPGSSHELTIRVVDGNATADWHFTGGSSLEKELIEQGRYGVFGSG